MKIALTIAIALLASCASTPDRETTLSAEAKLAPIDLNRSLVEVDGNLRFWNNLKLAPPSEERTKQIDAAERAIGNRVKERFEEFAAEMETGTRRNRIIATAAIGFSKDLRSLPYLLQALKDSDSEIVGNALISLGVLASTDTPMENILEILAHHPSPGVRVDATYTVKGLVDAGLRHPDIPPALREALRDPEPGVRAQAAAALGALADLESLELLLPLLKDSKPLIASAAAFALGKIGDHRAIEPLIAAMESRSPRVRETAHWALVRITGQDKGESAWNWKR